MTIKVAVTGASGVVGTELLKQYPNSFPLVGDVRNPQEIEMAVKSERPDIIVHLAFLSDVDYCEDKKNYNNVRDVNVRGTSTVVRIAEKYDCDVVFLSSDHVFDGLWGNYKETSKPSPKNFYGFTKMTCEAMMAAFPNMKTIRTSYLLTPDRLNCLYNDLNSNEMKDYPTFIYRSFMHLPDFVSSLCEYLDNYQYMPDILHLSGSKITSWYEYAKFFATACGLNVQNVSPRTREIPGFTPRPHRAGLNVSLSKKLGLHQYSYMIQG